MGFRIRKTIKIAPGVRLNFGKKSMSTSIGKRGVGVTISPTRITTHVGIPGTGISYEKNVGRSKQNNKKLSVNTNLHRTRTVPFFVSFLVFLSLSVVALSESFGTPLLIGMIFLFVIVAVLLVLTSKRTKTESNSNERNEIKMPSLSETPLQDEEKSKNMSNNMQDNLSIPINHLEPWLNYHYPRINLLKRKIIQTNSFDSLVNSTEFQECKMSLPMILGKSVRGNNSIVDLAEIHSVLIVGEEKKEYSCLLECMILSLLFKKHPNEIKFVLMDMNKDSLTKFSKISNPFMAAITGQKDSVITSTKHAYDALKSLCELVDMRREKLKEADVYDIVEYNEKYENRKLKMVDGHEYLPSIIVVINEFGELILDNSKQVEIPMAYLCKYGANVGIYIVVSTKQQNRTVINQNVRDAFKRKILFNCSSFDFKSVELEDNIERLNNEGEFLYINGDNCSILQLAFLTKEDLLNVCDYISTQPGPVSPMELPCVLPLQKTSIVSTLDPFLADAAEIIVSSQMGSTGLLQRSLSMGYNRASRLMDQLESLGIVGIANGSRPRDVLLKNKEELNVILSTYSGSTVIVNHYGSSKNAKGKLTGYSLFEKKYILGSESDEYKIEEMKDIQNAYKTEDNSSQYSFSKELNSLIGLNSVKEEISSLANFIKLNQKRFEQGLPMTKISYHCVFTGNPGTGKTTVARLLAGLLKELGVLTKGQLIETDRSGLVAEYIGQTAIKTNRIIDSALDGVLFIDEAYTLAQGGAQDYGHEAIATLLKRMEDNRDRLVVVLAGYGNEMKMFINSNPGLKSRFNRYLNFPDYSAEELMDIFELYLNKQQYELSSDAISFVNLYFLKIVMEKQSDFGNARFVRNLFEKIIEQQANRLAEIQEYNKCVLKVIEKEDVMKGIERLS